MEFGILQQSTCSTIPTMSEVIHQEHPWMYHMRRGNFEEAWKFSDKVMQERTGKPCWHLPRHQQYFWNGTPLHNKRVLVRCYHGLGDTIQFVRFIPQLRAIAKEVTLWVQPSLIPLLKDFPGIDKLLPLHDGEVEADYDVDIEIMELSHIFRATTDSIPFPDSYLNVAAVSVFPADAFTVGLVWKAGPWDERRNIPFKLLKPLFENDDIDFVILQAAAEKNGWVNGYGLYPEELPLCDYAAVVKGLDLLITVDSMPAHLAGAMSTPVWTLLHANADWRWMIDRNDSPWYQSMKLFRQREQGNWGPVVNEICEALRQQVDCQSYRRLPTLKRA